MNKLGSVFILIGISLLLFVAFTKGKTYIEQKKLMKEYTSLTFTEAIEESSEQPEPENGDVLGILEIPKIDLKTPIAEGARAEDIRYAVGHLPSSGKVGNLGKKNQNFAIAGHRSYTYGKFFNRLDELNEGNNIIVYARNKIFTYKVFDKKIVKPTDVDVMNPLKDQSIITLITCHPKYSDKERLIVFSELVSEKTLDGSEFRNKVSENN
ncbi:sortase A [Oikeobacillus pervagus]|uniref:Sortase A n=1 Tax=Oikeobacillus pervagus TaxID=1325931 RepID=A0AAJ1WJC0_9BACI|nr:class D sortase [Oikeobacillus pervagus]MDQ0215278.1 sortase A [Oikeobacillus pervagus]